MSTDEQRANAAAGLADAKAQAAAGLASMFAADIPAEADATPVEATAPAVEQPQSVAPVEAQQTETSDEEDEFPSYTYIEVEDEDDDDEDDDVAVTPTAEEDDEFSEYDDVDSLKARLAKAEKEATFHREQSLKARQGQWRKRFEKTYPLADFDNVHATSRRSYERVAIKSHNDNYTKLKPHIDRLQAAAAQLKQTGVQEGRTAAALAWGSPVTGPDVQTVDQAAGNAEIQAAREVTKRTGDIAGLFKTMIKAGR